MAVTHLLVTNDFPPKIGGIQSYLYELWRRLPPSASRCSTIEHAGAAMFDAEPALSHRTDRRLDAPAHPPGPRRDRRARARDRRDARGARPGVTPRLSRTVARRAVRGRRARRRGGGARAPPRTRETCGPCSQARRSLSRLASTRQGDAASARPAHAAERCSCRRASIRAAFARSTPEAAPRRASASDSPTTGTAHRLGQPSRPPQGDGRAHRGLAAARRRPRTDPRGHRRDRTGPGATKRGSCG